MEAAAILAEAVRRIEACCDPTRILLFGSRARGNARAESDFDLVVVVDHVTSHWRLESELYAALAGLPASFDLIVYDTATWQKWSVLPAAFEFAVASQAQVLRAA